MSSSARRRAHVYTVELDPSVRGMIPRLGRQTYHELHILTLLAKEPVED